ncbi:MAG TPA: glycosyltransferase, partial [Hyphomicrobium sp.]|nr:glycosyltransferase [Hyphomicrobium sp.]
LVSYEGLAHVIAAFDLAHRRDQNVHLLIVGDGAERSSLETAAQKLNAHRAIHFAGRVAPELARSAYSAIDMAVYARIKTEVTDVVPPLKHLEAAAAGVAIIVSDVAPLKSFAQSTRAARSVPAGDTHALADAIADLASDRSQRQALGEAGRIFATEMTWQKTAEIISATYDELVSSDHS